MSREILFKAKRKDNGEWVEGYYYQIWQQGYICWGMINNMPDMVEVNPNTLCQYTGLTDKNGKRIWENDVVKCNKRKEGYDLYKVVWRKEFADFGVEPLMYKAQYPIGFTLGRTLRGCDYKVIGNIFDNPELLEVKE